jgi:hypothetical protein
VNTGDILPAIFEGIADQVLDQLLDMAFISRDRGKRIMSDYRLVFFDRPIQIAKSPRQNFFL